MPPTKNKPTVFSALRKAKSEGLVLFEDLPVPWKVNEHIHSGYRFKDSVSGCVKSLFTLSNESFNIWSHLVGLLLILYSATSDWYMENGRATGAHYLDSIIDISTVVASVVCLLCSVMWHTMNCHSRQSLMERFDTADLMGVLVLVTATTLTIEYTAFYCDTFWRVLYMTASGTLALAGFYSTAHPTLRHPNMSWLRVSLFLGVGLTGVAPVFHLVYSQGSEWTFYWYAPMAAVWLPILIGAVVYGTKFPESLWPGKFDYLGSSHNIWHTTSLLAILNGHSTMMHLHEAAIERGHGICV